MLTKSVTQKQKRLKFKVEEHMTTERKTAFINDRVAGVRLNRAQQSQESGGGEVDRETQQTTQGQQKQTQKHNTS